MICSKRNLLKAETKVDKKIKKLFSSLAYVAIDGFSVSFADGDGYDYYKVSGRFGLYTDDTVSNIEFQHSFTIVFDKMLCRTRAQFVSALTALLLQDADLGVFTVTH